MNSQREAFEKEFPLSEDTRWSDERGIYVVKDYDGKYPDPGQNMLYIAWQKGSEWQAATEQGVEEPVGHIGKNSEPQLLHDLPPYTKLYTHPPKPTECYTKQDCQEEFKRGFNDGWSYGRFMLEVDQAAEPTGGGVPEGYVLVPLDVVDREEILDKAMDYHFDWCGYASRSDLAEAARAVAYAARDIATQQPPEQDPTL